MASKIDLLPLDIIHTIFLNFPVKSLQRLKTVCKSWNAIISDRKFAKIHHQISIKNNSNPLFLLRTTSGRKDFSLVRFGDEKLQVKAVVQNPFNNYDAYVLCSGDGLVLLRNDYDNKHVYVLWNPSTRKQTKIWCPDIGWAYFGICRGGDPNFDDYKIVFIRSKHYRVFSCKDNTWTKRRNFAYNIIETPNNPIGIFVDGFTFWVSTDLEHDCKEIIYFDPRDDMFKKLPKPRKLLEGATNGTFYLVRLNYGLCLCTKVRFEDIYGLQIWMMEGRVDLCNWPRLAMIIGFDTSSIDDVRPICLREKNGIALLNMKEFPHAMIYNSLRAKFEDYSISVPVDYYHWCYIISYLDTLFFPIHDNLRPKRKRKRSAIVLD